MTMTELTTTARGATALTTPGQVSPWREAANEDVGASFGTLLKFVKGDWIVGEDKTEVVAGTPFIINMDEIWRGWVKWEDNKPVAHVIGRIADRFRVPLREELDERDKIGSDDDPWQLVRYAVMKDTSADETVTFTTTSDGGRKAVGKVCDLYDRQRHKHPGRMPVVVLESGSYFSKKYNTDVEYPKFKLITWEYWDEDAKQDPAGTLQAQHAREMDDAIPF